MASFVFCGGGRTADTSRKLVPALRHSHDISNADEVCPSFVIKEWKRLGLFCRKADSKGSFTKLVPDPGTPTLPRRSSVSRYLILYLINLGFEGPAPEYFRIMRVIIEKPRIFRGITWV